MASQGGKLEEGETRLTLLEDGDEELNNGEKPVLPEQSLTPINTMGGYKKRQRRKQKQKTIFPTHGTDSAHQALCSWYLT